MGVITNRGKGRFLSNNMLLAKKTKLSQRFHLLGNLFNRFLPLDSLLPRIGVFKTPK
jgi:hypothetical protein